MLEVLVVVTILGYSYYLWNYANLRSKSKKETTESSPRIERAEMQADLVEEKYILKKSASLQGDVNDSQAPFVDKKMIAGLAVVIFTSMLVVAVVKQAESVHMPYLVAVCAAIAIGFAEPKRGWFLALVQCVMVLSGYFLLTELPETTSKTELENFSLYGSVILTFVASFLGGFMKRALNTD